MDLDVCRHMLLNLNNEENEPQAGSDAPVPLKREFQHAMRNTLLSPAACMGGIEGACTDQRAGSKAVSRTGGVGGIAPRVLSFSERPPPPQERYTNVLKVGSDLNDAIWCQES